MIAYSQIEQSLTSDSNAEATVEADNFTNSTDSVKEEVVKAENVLEPEAVDSDRVIPPVLGRQNSDDSVDCFSERLQMSFKVHVQNEAVSSSQRCYILTLHDIGHDYNDFQELVMSPEMSGLRSRIVWLHVDLPGQGTDCPDLTLKKYPSLEEVAQELVVVLDHFKVPQVVCLGDGAGANIAVNFAIKHPNRCLGVALVEPIASSASFIELMRYKLNNLNLFQKQSSNSPEKANVILSHFRKSSEPDSSLIHLNSSEKKLYENRSVKNLALFADTFLNRTSLTDKIESLTVDVLTVAGKHSSSYSETKKFFKTLQESRRRNPRQMVNCPFLEVDCTARVIRESPDKLATIFQFFLQGIGLLSAMPMKNSLKVRGYSLSSNGRSSSIEDPEPAKPRSQSQSESGSQLVSSNPSISIPEN